MLPFRRSLETVAWLVIGAGLALPAVATTVIPFEQASDFSGNFNPTAGAFAWSSGGGAGGSGGLVRDPEDGSITVFTYTAETVPDLGPGRTVVFSFDFQLSGPDTGAIGVLMRAGLKPVAHADDGLIGSIGAGGGLYATAIGTGEGATVDYAGFAQPGALATRVYGTSDGSLSATGSAWLNFQMTIEGLSGEELRVTTAVTGAGGATSTSSMTTSIENGAPYEFGISMNDSIVAFDNFTYVPEPSIALLSSMALGMLLRRRR